MRKKVGIIGAGGLIGTALRSYFNTKYDVRIIKSRYLYGEETQLIRLLEDLDVIINLAGHPVVGRWTKASKKIIYDSRIETTKNLVRAISMLKVKPSHYLNASAVGIYADGLICDEDSLHFADNFLSRLVKDWENEVFQIQNVNYSIVRIGVVLSRDGGAYSMIRKIFNLGIGGPMGSGSQGFSFILIDDLVRIFDFLIENKIYGIINGVGPSPSTNREFSLMLAKILRRPAFFQIPSVFIELLYGEGSLTILEGQKVIPKRLNDYKFAFIGNNLETSLNIMEK